MPLKISKVHELCVLGKKATTSDRSVRANVYLTNVYNFIGYDDESILKGTGNV